MSMMQFVFSKVTSHLQASSLRRYQILPPTSRLYHEWLPSICIFHSNGFQKNMQMTVSIAFRVTQYIKQQKQKVFLLAALNLFCGLSFHHFLKRKLRIKTPHGYPYFFSSFSSPLLEVIKSLIKILDKDCALQQSINMINVLKEERELSGI